MSLENGHLSTQGLEKCFEARLLQQCCHVKEFCDVPRENDLLSHLYVGLVHFCLFHDGLSSFLFGFRLSFPFLFCLTITWSWYSPYSAPLKKGLMPIPIKCSRIHTLEYHIGQSTMHGSSGFFSVQHVQVLHLAYPWRTPPVDPWIDRSYLLPCSMNSFFDSP